MDRPENWQPRHRGEGKVILGIALAAVGVLSLLHMLHLLPLYFFNFHFGWPLILIVIGIAIGVKNNFRRNAWWILIAIGVAHLVPSFYIGDVPSRRLLWPLVLIAAGLAVIFRKHRPHEHFGRRHRWQGAPNVEQLSHDADTVNIDVTFSGRKEIITSRSFKGGTVRAAFSGVELNLSSAEAGTLPMVLEVYASFSGVEIIVPSHWEIQNEIRPTLGSVEDSRTIRTGDGAAERRVLVLRGSCTFGSIELKSY